VADVGVANIMARQVLCGETLNLFEDGRQIRDFVYIDDVADLIVAATTKGIGPENFGVFNVGTGEGVSLAELADAIHLAAGREPSCRVSGEYRIGDVRHSVADMATLRTRIAWNPVPIDKGVAGLVEWLRTSKFV
jgi:dTDP-L-rhamnose 4-epimerase